MCIVELPARHGTEPSVAGAAVVRAPATGTFAVKDLTKAIPSGRGRPLVKWAESGYQAWSVR